VREYWDKRYAVQGMKTVGHISFNEREFDVVTERSVRLLRASTAGILSGRVLDLGCGWGRMSRELVGMGCEIHGLDVAEWAIEKARETVPSGTFGLFDGKTIPYTDGHFNGVLTWTVLQHVPEHDLGFLSQEIVRVLAPGGMLICYENISAAPSAGHIWFRSEYDYRRLFQSLIFEAISSIKGMDGTREVHAIMRWGKT
jgi:2-polyprenyl-3-methyl-5-hydroxy-6-metoxy-1,4-benzoquinol methylase